MSSLLRILRNLANFRVTTHSDAVSWAVNLIHCCSALCNRREYCFWREACLV